NSAPPPVITDLPGSESTPIVEPAIAEAEPVAESQSEASAPEAPERREPASLPGSSPPEDAPAEIIRPDTPEPEDEKFERKTFFEKGFDSSVTSELTMADIMEKVAATRPRIGDTETSAPSSHEASASEMRLRAKGEPMFQR